MVEPTSDTAVALTGLPESVEDLADLPTLFAEFSRVTADLVASHDLLREQVVRLEGELADKNRRLERKKRLEALGRVAAGVAHEFRNPLGGIRLTVDSLLGDDPTPRAEARLEHVRHAVSHLDHIVEDLLTFTGSPVIDRTPVPIEELIDQSLSIAFPAHVEADERRVQTSGPPGLVLSIDRHSMTQVLVNLLTNASQATPSGGTIGVWWGRREECDWIEVADDGPGIPEGEEERIFHPFHSLRDGGTGLGLAIVHSRVEAHDGEIAVVTDPWGAGDELRGARFRVQLPRRRFEQETR